MTPRGIVTALLFAWLALPGAASAEPLQADIGKLSAGMPKDVTGYISRRVQCNHWDKLEAHHKASRREIDAAQVKLHCDGLEWEEKILCRKHARDKLILKRIDLARDYS